MFDLEGKSGVFTVEEGSGQLVPALPFKPTFRELMSDPDPAKAGRVMQAMMQMTKIDIAGLKRAYDQR